MLDSTQTFDTALADEDRWTVPDEWWARAVPTRGYGSPRPVSMMTDATYERAELLATYRNYVVETLDLMAAAGNTDLAEAGRAAMDDPAGCAPLGAAVLAAAVDLGRNRRPQGSEHTADAWVIERGMVFAAEAATLLAGLRFGEHYDPVAGRWTAFLDRHPADYPGHSAAPEPLIRMRAHLAAIPEDEYRAVVTRLGVLRRTVGGLAVRLATTFLAPTEQQWVAEDVDAVVPIDSNASRFIMLAASVTSRADLERVIDAAGTDQLPYFHGSAYLYSALIRLGPECAGVLDRLLRRGEMVSEAAELLSRLPSDEAFGILNSRSDQRFLAPALLEAAKRFPRRAVRMLRPRAARSALARQILRAVAHAHPDLVAELPELAAFAGGRQRPATAAELPELLRIPPWQRPRQQGTPLVLTDLLAPSPDALAGEPDDRAAVSAWMVRRLDGRKTRPTALAWFDRHLTTALPNLIAAALATPGKDRGPAEAALRTLADRGHRPEIESAAARFDDRVIAAIGTVLDTDPLSQLPTKIPATPEWLTPELLPAIALRATDAVLPVHSAADVCTMLAMCGPSGDYAGVARLAELVDADSLAEFAWSVFEMWRLADYPAKDTWVLRALALVGDDETARRIGPLIRIWPGQSAHARAVSGLDILTEIGSDVALMQLHAIAEKVQFKGLKAKAQERIAEVAEGLGLTPEELADRLVPDFGLAANGTLALDYGPRGFVIGFDEHLKPTVSDAIRGADDSWQPTGLRKSLPKPGVKDDPELAPAAYKSFTDLKKDVKSAAADQIPRFERAMVQGRRWSAAVMYRLFVQHPLLWHPIRRLVWATFDADGTPTGSFRIAEDRSYADVHDDPVSLAEDTLVGIAHPLHLGTSLAAWGELFADYEILQPFPQLQREILAFARDELTASTLTRFEQRTVPTGKLLGLTRFGWERGEPMDGGVSIEFVRNLADGRSVVIGLDPGILAGAALEWAEQQITVRLTETGHESYWQRGEHSGPVFADLPPITASELLRELNQLIA
ncbi:DUF4132 domain-containing protein [Nocardia sp. NPDC051030]|uniref:DUF4132 domain-containing protein n=1 Tax=Nocardia sp. NPDC051030 TaxID=3155162 RepID=UPI00343BE8A2